jgi:ATP-dependent protease ClpP protease subunit
MRLMLVTYWRVFLAAQRFRGMKWAFLFSSLLIFNAVAHAEPTKVSDRTKCFTFDGKDECSFTIYFVGEITPASVNEVAALIDQKRDWNGLKQLLIDSPGGNIYAAMAIGRLLRRNRIHVFVASGDFGDGQCVSACIMVYAGAVSRLHRGKIGIHRPYFNLQPNPEELQSGYEQMLRNMRTYLRDMNVSERLAEDMLKVAPADVRYLSDDDLKNYGLVWKDPIEQETLDLEEAQSLGVDRSEFIRRQALQKTKCMKVDDVATCRQRIMQFGN